MQPHKVPKNELMFLKLKKINPKAHCTANRNKEATHLLSITGPFHTKRGH